MKRALVIATVLCLGAASAVAKPSTTVFPLTAPNLPMKIASAPEQLSKALADELGGEVAKLPIDDAAGLAGCDPEATSCLETVAKNFKSKRIVFGSISMLDEDRLKVTLTRYDPGPDRQQRTFTGEGSVDEMADELIKLSCPLFEGSECEEEEKPIPPDVPKPIEGGKGGEVSGTTYVLLVGGGAVFAAGAGFLYSSIVIGNEVNAAKPRTDPDFAALVVLERQGEQRQKIGAGLLAGGAVVLGIGIIRAVIERSTPASRESSTTSRRLTPVPIQGGAALVFSMELP